MSSPRAPAVRSPREGDVSGVPALSTWTSGFETLNKNATWVTDSETNKDSWEFEGDTFAMGIIAITKEGLPGAALPLIISLATPCIQLLAFFKIFEGLISESPSMTDPVHGGASYFVRLICFLLSALSLSNEALEGFHKLVFSLRASAGIYSNAPGIPSVGVILAFFQYSMVIGAIGLTMVVVSEQVTALDAFMNFVALAFLTEIDNIVMSARTVQNFVQTETEYEGIVCPQAFAYMNEEAPWTVKMMIACNLLLGVAFSVVSAMYMIAAEMSPVRESISMKGHLPSAFLCWLSLDVVMWFGSKKVGAMKCSMILFGICVAMDFMDKVYLYSTNTRLLSPFTIAVTYWFELLGPVTACSVVRDPFELLSCPYKTPMLVWIMLVQGVFWFDSLYRYGVD